MTYSVRTFAQQPEVRHHIERLSNEAWPPFLQHGDIDHWHLLFEIFPEYQLLLFFAEHKGKMLSREFILERVWGWDFIGDSRTVDVHVAHLRKKLEEGGAPRLIHTVRGAGYVLRSGEP